MQGNIYKPRYKITYSAKSKVWPYKDSRLRRFFNIRGRKLVRRGQFKRHVLVFNNMKWTIARRYIRPYMRRRKALKRRYKDDFYNKQQMRNFYGKFKEKTFRSFFRTHLSGVMHRNESFYSALERRADMFLFRTRVLPTIYAATQYVQHQGILLNGGLEKCPNALVRPGYVLQFTPEYWKVFSEALEHRIYFRVHGMQLMQRRVFKRLKKKMRWLVRLKRYRVRKEARLLKKLYLIRRRLVPQWKLFIRKYLKKLVLNNVNMVRKEARQSIEAQKEVSREIRKLPKRQRAKAWAKIWRKKRQNQEVGATSFGYKKPEEWPLFLQTKKEKDLKLDLLDSETLKSESFEEILSLVYNFAKYRNNNKYIKTRLLQKQKRTRFVTLLRSLSNRDINARNMNVNTLNNVLNNTQVIKKAQFRINIKSKKHSNIARSVRKSLKDNRKISSILLKRRPMFSALGIKKTINIVDGNNVTGRKSKVILWKRYKKLKIDDRNLTFRVIRNLQNETKKEEYTNSRRAKVNKYFKYIRNIKKLTILPQKNSIKRWKKTEVKFFNYLAKTLRTYKNYYSLLHTLKQLEIDQRKSELREYAKEVLKDQNVNVNAIVMKRISKALKQADYFKKLLAKETGIAFKKLAMLGQELTKRRVKVHKWKFRSFYNKEEKKWEKTIVRSPLYYFMANRRIKVRRRLSIPRLKRVHWFIPTYIHFDMKTMISVFLHHPKANEIHLSFKGSLPKLVSYYISR